MALVRKQRLSADQYKRTPWKNGQGSSTEIAIYPEDAIFSENNFLWRISSAKIFQISTFSKFPGYDRVLTVWEGAGLKLNGTLLELYQTYAFPGEELIQCEPLTEEIIDLGVIYQRSKCRVKFTVCSSLTCNESHTIELTDGQHFIVCAQGGFYVEEDLLERADSLRYEGFGSLVVRSLTPSSSYFLITIRPL